MEIKIAIIALVASVVVWRKLSHAKNDDRIIKETFVRLQSEPITSLETLKSIYYFKKAENDVIVCSFPKSGTHLTAFMVWLLLTNGKELKQNIHNEARMFEGNRHWINGEYQGQPANDKNERVYFTHLPPSVLLHNANENTKFVYVTRDIRDVIPSYRTMLSQFDVKMGGIDKDMSLEDFAKKVLVDKNVLYGGDWTKHLLEWYNVSLIDKRILIVTFEDLVKRPMETLMKVHNHVGKPKELDSTTRDRILHYTSFTWMKENEALFTMMNKQMLKVDGKQVLINEGKVLNANRFTEGGLQVIRDYLKASLVGKRDDEVAFIRKSMHEMDAFLLL